MGESALHNVNHSFLQMSATPRVGNPQILLYFVAVLESLREEHLCTDARVDQNFQRDLGAIGPYPFQEKSVWTD